MTKLFCNLCKEEIIDKKFFCEIIVREILTSFAINTNDIRPQLKEIQAHLCKKCFDAKLQL